MGTMYVHIGGDTVVHSQDIITILDNKTMTISKEFHHFLHINEKYIVPLTNDTFKSIIVTVDRIYLSSLTSATIKKRLTERSLPNIS